jgi:choline-glycine betaine transporter
MMQKKPPFVGESKMEELQINGLSGVMDDDWAADAQKAVIMGADGLWLRFGASPGPSFCQQVFAFQFNPCVSFFAVVLLFGLVAFCCVTPGKFCTQTVEVYQFTDNGAVRNVKLVDPQPAVFPTGTNSALYVINGALTTGAKQFNAQLDTANHQLTLSGQVYTIIIQKMIEDQTCFMPKKEFDDWMAWVTECFTWLYIITQNVWIVFAVWLYFSKYGNIKLGRDEDEPEFTYFAWFSMLFTCGVATGLFYFAVTEPQYYYLIGSQNNGYSERNRWSYSGVYVQSTGDATGTWSTPNDRAQNAMTTTWYHWGLHGWVCYCLLGVLLAFLHFRKGLPMTIKTCFYPLMGMRIYGFMGDFLDTISVVATTMGVCTSLGLGVIQLNTGLEMLNGDQHWLGKGYYNTYNWNEWSDRESDLKSYWDSWSESLKLASPWYDTSGQVVVSTVASVAKVEAQSNQQQLLIWIITTSATCSVMLGLKNGIKQLALLCLALGQFVIFYVWMMDDTWFLSNLFIQTIGNYIGQLPILGFYSSAVEQSEVNNPYGEYSSWQFWWTIFYWGWWIAWAPFVGVFLARVGKARTVKEFVFCTLFSACIYNFIFMTMLGGAGLKMQMLAEKHGIGTPGSGPGTGSDGCNNDIIVQAPNNGTYYRQISYKANVCRQTSTRKYSGEKEMFCSTITNLACSLKADGTRPLFDVMQQYADVAKGMTVILLITITLYFVASSDSGSMVDDMITANGLPEPCLSQRLFWALTEGAAATALLSIGKYVGQADGGLKALRSASICVGLPYTFLICFMCVSLYRALQYEAGDRNWFEGGFKNSILDLGVTLYKCGPSLEGGQKTRCFNGQCGSFDFKKMIMLIRNFFCPPLAMWSITSKISNKRTGNRNSIGTMILVVSVSLFFLGWFTLQFVDYSPLSSNLQEWGSVIGNPSSTDGNVRYYLSNRWGYYHQWANKDDQRSNGDFIRWNTNVNQKGQEKSLTQTINGVATSVGVGERMAFNYRIAVVGWFFFFIFVMFCVSLRSDVRVIMKIPGTLVEDFLVCLFWPCALQQMDEQLNEPTPAGVDEKKII